MIKKINKKISLLTLSALILGLPVTAKAASYYYSAPIVWHSVDFNSGNSFNITTPNPSLSSASQKLYKGGSLGVKYELSTTSGSPVKSFSRYGTYSNQHWYFGNVTSGRYRVKATNLYDDNNTAFTLTGTFNY